VTEPLVALTIKQPWASLIVLGIKDIENRSWPTRRRGRFLVHASKAVDRREIARAREIIDRTSTLRDEPAIEAVFDLDRLRERAGGILGSVELVDCHDAHPSPWFQGPYGFSLRAPAILPFTPLIGRLNFFPVPDDVARRLAA
jgi:hypothetical protein